MSHYRDYAPASAIVLVAIVWYLAASGWHAATGKRRGGRLLPASALEEEISD